MDVTPFSIAFVNRKGGCGKTATTFLLSGCLAKMGLRVLCIDMDPQANLTQGFLGPEQTERLPRQKTVISLFDDTLEPDPERTLLKTQYEGISLFAGSDGVEEFNLPKPRKHGPLQTALRGYVKEVKGEFDAILIDCPPTLQTCTWNALLAADFVVVPLQPEDFGSQGITAIQREIDQALMSLNPSLRMLGYLVTLKRQVAIHRGYEQQLRQLYGEDVLEAVVPLRTSFTEAIALKTPIHFWKPTSLEARAINRIADEILARIPIVREKAAEFLHADNRLVASREGRVAV